MPYWICVVFEPNNPIVLCYVTFEVKDSHKHIQLQAVWDCHFTWCKLTYVQGVFSASGSHFIIIECNSMKLSQTFLPT
jgi:hypothetical protein